MEMFVFTFRAFFLCFLIFIFFQVLFYYLHTKSANPDQRAPPGPSDLGLHFLQMTPKRVARAEWANPYEIEVYNKNVFVKHSMPPPSV